MKGKIRESEEEEEEREKEEHTVEELVEVIRGVGHGCHRLPNSLLLLELE